MADFIFILNVKTIFSDLSEFFFSNIDYHHLISVRRQFQQVYNAFNIIQFNYKILQLYKYTL